MSSPKTPERLPGIVDAHCHLQHAWFDADRDAVIERARDCGVEIIVVPGWDVASSEAALELAARHGPLVRAAVGVHPHDASAMDEAAWGRLERLVADDGCVAVGEIGLDFHRNLSPPDVQRAAFARQLERAAAVGKPVIVHDREAHAEVTDALAAWAERLPSPHPGMLHAFSGDLAMARALTAVGYLISFALPVTFRSAASAREAASRLPPDRLLTETDAPYLGPVQGERNEPGNVVRVAAGLGALRGERPEDVARNAQSALERMLGSG